MNSLKSTEGHRRLLRAWQLAILRFAITLDDSDRLNVAGVAAEVDRLGAGRAGSSLHFFRRTSSELCAAVLGQRENSETILKRFHAEVDEPRLKLALAAVLGIGPETIPIKRRPKLEDNLFRGLPSRKARA
ncbi:hypothetical protein AYJ54_44620 [Bradyrhizobium centrolobii]|uniref:Uncharacterized protein n=1 Tax=Bradyrhizobium centrolobii TaxID=1505087 RepID=A0A176Z184_9BRAD|nr:hypothetical protein [Bradyrhizobium centrolobii]OAF13415.1 hypothetical protein AYJ54_44620 [Bradyrhizobium centrolobii]